MMPRDTATKLRKKLMQHGHIRKGIEVRIKSGLQRKSIFRNG